MDIYIIYYIYNIYNVYHIKIAWTVVQVTMVTKTRPRLDKAHSKSSEVETGYVILMLMLAVHDDERLDC